MKITKPEIDYIIINENNVEKLKQNKGNEKIHLIKLNFIEPTEEKIFDVINTFTKTNRYVISNNIKIYNDTIKKTGKKYYVENRNLIPLISYLRKNNKILINYMNLQKNERELMLETNIFDDTLKNVEVILIDSYIFEQKRDCLEKWNGNVILV
jgi:hypothetical protein